MNPGVNRPSKKERLEYIKRNRTLLEILSAYCGLAGTTYEEMVEYLEEKGENTAGLLIRLERGINLGLIEYDGGSGLKDGQYYLSRKYRGLPTLKKPSIPIARKKKIEEERLKKEEKMRERLRYVS